MKMVKFIIMDRYEDIPIIQTKPTVSANVASLGGSKTLSDTLTQVRITTVNGTDTFDAGTINILYE